MQLPGHGAFLEGMPAVSSTKNPKVIYTNPGNFNVKLRVTNIAGTDSVTYSNFVTVKSRSYATISPVVCNEGYYTSPSGIYTWYTNGTYHDTIPNHAGCDSIITINLTFTSIDPSVSLTGNMLTSNSNGANFQWLDCDNEFSAISGKIINHLYQLPAAIMLLK